MHPEAQQFNTEILAGESVLEALRRVSRLPDERVIEAACKGAVWITQRRGRGKTRPRRLRSLSASASQGSTVMLNYNPTVLATQPLTMWCVSDHVNYGIWYKPSGMLCQGSKWSDHTTVTEVAASMRKKPCYLVHRLDRAACGLLVLAYTKNALRALAELFAQRQIIKHYSARVRGEALLDFPMTLDTPIDDRSAKTSLHGKRFDSLSNTSTLHLTIATGRKHQIRKHLAGIGFPIVGDRLHTPAPGVNPDEPDLQLVAHELTFNCPFTQEQINVAIDAEKALAGQLTA